MFFCRRDVGFLRSGFDVAESFVCVYGEGSRERGIKTALEVVVDIVE